MFQIELENQQIFFFCLPNKLLYLFKLKKKRITDCLKQKL